MHPSTGVLHLSGDFCPDYFPQAPQHMSTYFDLLPYDMRKRIAETYWHSLSTKVDDHVLLATNARSEMRYVWNSIPEHLKASYARILISLWYYSNPAEMTSFPDRVTFCMGERDLTLLAIAEKNEEQARQLILHRSTVYPELCRLLLHCKTGFYQ